jgi:TRAP-type C4-dicarboxylate transport system permease large subunit
LPRGITPTAPAREYTAFGGIRIKDAVQDTAILFMPTLLMLLVVILFPDLMLWLPRMLMPRYVK